MVRRTSPRFLLAFVFSTATGCNAHIDVLGPAPPAARDATTPPSPDARVPPGDEEAAPVPTTASHVVAAFSDTCAVTDGALYCWGTAPDGRTRARPELVTGGGAASWVRTTSGLRAHCAEQANGSVWCWGANEEGQLGQGDTAARAEPTRVTLPRAATEVAGRFASFCARLEDGTLYCWGANEEGQLAQDDPFSAGDGVDRTLPVPIAGTDWLGVDCGQGHTCAIRGTGSLLCWGRNGMGEIGLGPGVAGQLRTPMLVGGSADWTSVSAGQQHTCGIRRPGTLHCFGDNTFGQLGLAPGDRAPRDVPTQVGTDTDWLEVSVDTFHSCGIRSSGTLYCWGRNIEGQLGVGDIADRDVPAPATGAPDWVQVSVGRFHTCGRRSDDSVWCTGENDDGRLGTGDFDRRNEMTRVAWGP